MKKNTNVASFTDLLFCAKTLGIDWNTAHDILDKDGIRPEYETRSIDYHISDLNSNAYGWSDDTMKILTAFYAQENVTEFTLVDD